MGRQQKPSASSFSKTRRGSIGELRVQSDLLLANYDVYSPVCDDHSVDLVVESKEGFHKVQIKSVGGMMTKSSIEVRFAKYVEAGRADRIDVIAIYFEPSDIIAYIEYEGQLSFNLALKKSANNQKKGVRWFYDYMDFPFPAIRGIPEK
jgi:hypothetical protein